MILLIMIFNFIKQIVKVHFDEIGNLLENVQNPFTQYESFDKIE